MPNFPTLSREISLKTKESIVDPTLRDSMENGIETTRARWTRQRRQFSISIDYLTQADVDALHTFINTTVAYGALSFNFTDTRPETPRTYVVRFSVLPSFTDAAWIQSEFRQNCSFELREV